MEKEEATPKGSISQHCGQLLFLKIATTELPQRGLS